MVPARTTSRYYGDLVEGLDILELRTVIMGAARFFSFTASDEVVHEGAGATRPSPGRAREG